MITPRYVSLAATLAFCLILPTTPVVAATHSTKTKATAAAKPAAKVSPQRVDYIYLAPHSVPPNLLPAPARPKSKAWRAGVDKVVSIQKYVASSEIEKARQEQTLAPELVTAPLGAQFSRASLPRTFKFLDNIVADSLQTSQQAQKYWRVPLAERSDKRVKLLLPRSAHAAYAYPDATSAVSMALARVLGDVRPAASNSLLAQAQAVAARRLVVGHATPQDVRGGQQLGEAIYLQLKNSPLYRLSFSAVQAELQAAESALATLHGCPTKPAKKNWKRFKSRVTE